MSLPISNADPNSGYQYVPVPNEHLSAVFRLLGNLSEGSADLDNAGVLNEQVTIARDWTDDEVQRLAQSDGRIYDLIRAVYDHLSAHPDKWFGTDELAVATGVKISSIRALPTQMQRSFKVHFDGRSGLDDREWGTKQDPARPPQMYFRFTVDTADKWLRTRN